MDISALNNSSVDDNMSIDDLLGAADRRLDDINRDAVTPLSQHRERNQRCWRSLVDTACKTLPPSIRPFIRAERATNRDDYPSELAVAIDLPECERIHYGPWVYDREAGHFSIADPWRNKPFEVGGGNRETFGDLLDAVARAREVYRMKFEDVDLPEFPE